MSASFHVMAMRELDGRFKAMMDLKKMCDTAKVTYPPEVVAYFEREAGESESYLRDKMAEVDVRPLLRKWNDDAREGFEIDVKSIPPEVKTLRFYMSW